MDSQELPPSFQALPSHHTHTSTDTPEALDIPSISQVYTEAHIASLARTRLQGDSTINAVLDHTLRREAGYTQSRQTTSGAEKVVRETLHLNTIDGEVPNFTVSEAGKLRHSFISKIRSQVRNTTRTLAQDQIRNHVNTLQVPLQSKIKKICYGSHHCFSFRQEL